jgi:Secretion system C-terminal sorting domain/PKD domain
MEGLLLHSGSFLSPRYCLLAIFLLLFSINSIQAKTVVIRGGSEFITVHDRTVSSSSQPPPNVPPIADAGPDQTITAPASSVILNGSASNDPDGTIVSYSWVLISGLGSVIISNSNQVIAGVSGLTPGSYTFQLTVTDDSGATSNDSVTVTVNPAINNTNQSPVAIAGSDTTIYLPASSFQLNASNSYDPDGNITSYQWQEISGPNTAAASSMNSPEVDLSGLEEGIYQFQLTVTDNQGASSTATVKITVDKNSGAPDQFTVFPNPAQDILNCRINSSLNGTIRMVVYDMIGRLVIADEAQKSVDLYEKSLNVSGLASGMYSIQVNIANMKFMITKFFKK